MSSQYYLIIRVSHSFLLEAATTADLDTNKNKILSHCTTFRKYQYELFLQHRPNDPDEGAMDF